MTETTMARICWAVIVLFLILAFFAFLVDARVIPAPPWSPMGHFEHAHHHVPTPARHVVRGEQA
jgi:hypothetical protein